MDGADRTNFPKDTQTGRMCTIEVSTCGIIPRPGIPVGT